MFLALREIRFAKGRYSLIAAIMVLVAFLVLFVTGLAQGLAYDNASSIQNMSATHFVLEEDANHRFIRSQLEQQQLEAVGAIAGEENAEPLGVRMTTVMLSGSSTKLDVTLLAVRSGSWLAPDVIEGMTISDQMEGYVVVDEKLKAYGIVIGSVLVDEASGIEWRVDGFVKDESFSHTPAVFLNMKDWQLLQTRNANPAGGQPSYNAIAVKASKSIATKLRQHLPGTETVTKSEAVSAIPGYKEEQGSLKMMIAFLFIISAFVLAVFFYVMTIQKTSQFGILKAIGSRTSYLAGSVALQVLLLSLVSLIVSVLLLNGFEALLPSTMPFQLEVSTLALTCLLFMLLSLAGSLFSVWKVAGIDALEAIGRTAP
ncbi:ABC transporter permease [Paenibacillus sp. HB172176]|uniref:ABC transporter permease n=1 Tax=Paenibacillus sp. HB172176 TaxID=2493690 RepID=UPI00143BBDA7|nr:ABC transporter permease [Paenibacillus sp. HB172176]